AVVEHRTHRARDGSAGDEVAVVVADIALAPNRVVVAAAAERDDRRLAGGERDRDLDAATTVVEAREPPRRAGPGVDQRRLALPLEGHVARERRGRVEVVVGRVAVLALDV